MSTAFEDFFNDKWQDLLEGVAIPRDAMSQPDTGEPSWDRKAAWLLWQERGRADEFQQMRPESAKGVETDDGY